MGKIVAIGGGNPALGETRKIDEYLVRIAHKERPKLLFLPTASGDSEEEIAFFSAYFCGMDCQPQVLRLVKEPPSSEQIETKMMAADIIYVGEGNTAQMLSVFKTYGVDTLLRRAYEKGTILCGLGAGTICWSVFGHSCSDSVSNKGWWDYRRLPGLALIPAAICPRYNHQEHSSFDRMMVGEALPGVALEDGAALVEEDGEYYLLSGEKGGKGWLLRGDARQEFSEDTASQPGEPSVHKTELSQGCRFRLP